MSPTSLFFSHALMTIGRKHYKNIYCKVTGVLQLVDSDTATLTKQKIYFLHKAHEHKTLNLNMGFIQFIHSLTLKSLRGSTSPYSFVTDYSDPYIQAYRN